MAVMMLSDGDSDDSDGGGDGDGGDDVTTVSDDGEQSTSLPLRIYLN